jgi:hypothetical protein
MLERGVEQRDSPASSPLAPPNASRFGKHGTALFGSTDPNAGRNIRAEAAAKFFPTGRQRPDMHNLVPELKGFHDLTYDFRRQLDFTAVRPPCLNRQSRQEIAQDPFAPEGLVLGEQAILRQE